MSIWTTRSTVAGHLAMWAVRQSPYACPEQMRPALEQFCSAFPGDVNDMSEWRGPDELGDAIWAAIEASPAVLAWNKPASGHSAQIVFSSRYDKPSPDDDFIDLHALARNVERSVWAEESGQ